MEAGANQWGSARGGWREDRADRSVGSRRAAAAQIASAFPPSGRSPALAADNADNTAVCHHSGACDELSALVAQDARLKTPSNRSISKCWGPPTAADGVVTWSQRLTMSSQPKTFLTPEQYLEIERAAGYKSEYFQGEMFAMAGAK